MKFPVQKSKSNKQKFTVLWCKVSSISSFHASTRINYLFNVFFSFYYSVIPFFLRSYNKQFHSGIVKTNSSFLSYKILWIRSSRLSFAQLKLSEARFFGWRFSQLSLYRTRIMPNLDSLDWHYSCQKVLLIETICLGYNAFLSKYFRTRFFRLILSIEMIQLDYNNYRSFQELPSQIPPG